LFNGITNLHPKIYKIAENQRFFDAYTLSDRGMFAENNLPQETAQKKYKSATD